MQMSTATMNAMRNDKRYQTDDNPIDWSSFDESSLQNGPVDGSIQLRIVSIILLVLGLAALIAGVNGFGAQLEQMNGAPTFSYAVIDPLLLAGTGLLTLVPACFGLQTASTAVSFVAPTVLGLIGIVFMVIMTGVELFMSLMGSEGSMIPWIVGIVLSIVYLYFVVRVHRAANDLGRAKRRPTKEELWDENNIWK